MKKHVAPSIAILLFIIGCMFLCMPVNSEASASHKAYIDRSRVQTGVIDIYWIGEGGKTFQVFIIGPDGDSRAQHTLKNTKVRYAYTLPLTFGDGEYEVVIWEKNDKEDPKYTHVLSAKIEVALDDPDLPFLAPNMYVPFTDGSEVVLLAKALSEGKIEAHEIANVFCLYIVKNIKYDYAKLEKMKNHHSYYPYPDIRGTIIKQTGVCQDQAALLCALLRSQGIPAMLVFGEVGIDDFAEYHAWVRIKVGPGVWVDADPTRVGCILRQDPSIQIRAHDWDPGASSVCKIM